VKKIVKYLKNKNNKVSLLKEADFGLRQSLLYNSMNNIIDFGAFPHILYPLLKLVTKTIDIKTK
jgi:hypothetical protein